MSNSSSSSPTSLLHCMDLEAAKFILTSFILTKVALHLPLSTLILYMGHRRWRRQRSFAAMSHSDIFTYHIAAMELIFVLGIMIYFCGLYTGLSEFVTVGIYASSVVFPGEISFHLLTCVERYLAVVHPITYRGLRQSGGVRIRNITIGCVWLLCFGWIGLTAQFIPYFPYIPLFCLLVLSLVVVSFCSICVLCVLIRPGPAEMGEAREQVDQSKQRAFYTITAIMGVLWLWFVGMLICVALDKSVLLSYRDGCLVLMSGNWLTLPSSLVLPLLFLQRAGKLLCCHCSNG